jgi:hypothetical protein
MYHWWFSKPINILATETEELLFTSAQLRKQQTYVQIWGHCPSLYLRSNACQELTKLPPEVENVW